MKCIVCSLKRMSVYKREDRTYEMDPKSSAWDFSCCGCSDWSPGIYKVSGKTGGSKSSRGNIQKERTD